MNPLLKPEDKYLKTNDYYKKKKNTQDKNPKAKIREERIIYRTRNH